MLDPVIRLRQGLFVGLLGSFGNQAAEHIVRRYDSRYAASCIDKLSSFILTRCLFAVWDVDPKVNPWGPKGLAQLTKFEPMYSKKVSTSSSLLSCSPTDSNSPRRSTILNVALTFQSFVHTGLLRQLNPSTIRSAT